MSDIRNDLKEAARGIEVLEYASRGELPPEPEPEEMPEYEAAEEVEEEEDSTSVESEDDEPSLEIAPASEPERAQPEEEDVPEPMTWAAEMRQHWKSLPSNVRKYIHERERQQHQYISRVGGEHGRLRKEFGEIEKALQPFEEEMRQAGMNKGQVVERLLHERAEMLRDPVTFIRRFADVNKVSLHELASQIDADEPPELRQARWQLQDRERALQEQMEAIQKQQYQAQYGQVTDFVEQWGAQKPHFNTVRQAMAAIMPEIQKAYPYLEFEQQLEATYTAALQHPHFKHLTAPPKPPVPPEVRKAANGLNGNSGMPSKTPEPASIREALLQAAKETGFF